MRLDDMLAAVLSIKSKAAQDIIAAGRVTVDASKQCEPRWQIVLGGEHQVSIDGQPLLSLSRGRPFAHFVLLANKPRGCVCERFRGSEAHNRSKGLHNTLPTATLHRRSLWDVVPAEHNHPTLGAFGRLDADTTGLILMGTDGGLQSLLMHPSCGCEKAYLATLKIDETLRLRSDAADEFARGVRLADGHVCRPARLELVETVELAGLPPFPRVVRLTLVEGQYHQVKKMLGACGAYVEALHRERIGAISLANYPGLTEGGVLLAGAHEHDLLRSMLPAHRVADIGSSSSRSRPSAASRARMSFLAAAAVRARDAASAVNAPSPILYVVSEAAHNRMLAWPGGGAANMEVPARLVAVRNSIHMLPAPLRAALREVDDVPLIRAEAGPGWWIKLERDLRRAHTNGFVCGMWARFLADDPEIIASITAVTSVLAIADKVLSPSPAFGHAEHGVACGLALVRPAGHHSTADKCAPLCAINSVMVAALREAHATGRPVGVLDLDVHFATGSQQIAMRWNEQRAATDGRVIVADVYGAMGPPDRLVKRVQKEYADLQGQGLDAASLKAEMEAEFETAKPHEKDVVKMVCDSHLIFPYDREELTDDAILDASTRSVEHFVRHGVATIFISLGLDAAAGDKEGAQVHPEGFGRVAKMLRKSGLKLVFALEGGYHVGDLDINDALSGVEDVERLSVDRYLGSGNFGKCLHAVAVALCER